jgi:hypothetical protein
MLQSFILCLALLFIGSCESESKFVTSPQGGYIEPQNTPEPQNPHQPQTVAQPQKLPDKKESILPPGYIECHDSLYWNMAKFEQNVPMHVTNKPKYAGQMWVIAEAPTEGLIRKGKQPKITGSDFSSIENYFCGNIWAKINVGTSENRIYQYFDYEAIKTIISTADEYKELDEKSAILDKIFFQFDEKNKEVKFLYQITLPVSVTCEKKWSVKRDPTSTTRAIFKEPAGKCNFSLHDYELKLPLGEKVLVAMKGYYEADPEDPDNRTLVMIETYGYKNLR